MKPSAKTIAARLNVSPEIARKIRREMERHDSSGQPFATETLERIGTILEAGGIMTHGAEGIPPGRGSRSPSIDYVNRGDTYDTTVLYLGGVTESGRATYAGRWAVGSWGGIVERGQYE